MIYYPYFRGKQYELICLRESTELVAQAEFCPIIEPVKSATGSLVRCLEALNQDNAAFLVVANPYFGDFKSGLPNALQESWRELIAVNEKAGWAYILGQNEHLSSLNEWLTESPSTAVIHTGGHAGNAVVEAMEAENTTALAHVFVESMCGKLYRNHFKGTQRILLRDGFQKRNNKLHPDIEPFSDLYLTYPDEGMDGFGDFSIVGDDYQESGGPAYAVAIHITFVDADQDSSMFIQHFKSDSNKDPTDPARKFREAVTKLRTAVEANGSKIARTAAIEEFIDLQKREHYPGLGYVKKLSMQHHLELMSTLL